MNLQPSNLENELVKLIPISANDFERLYKVASDPLIWEQHPEKERYKRDVFQKFFSEAVQSKSAFLIFDNTNSCLIGSSRYYDFNNADKSVAVGYSFLSRDHWGTKFNRALKTLMLNYAFRFVDTVYFHIGAENIRSQKAILKLGAVFSGEKKMSFGDQPPKINYIYKIEKVNWEQT